jgi:hypothetical protein
VHLLGRAKIFSFALPVALPLERLV